MKTSELQGLTVKELQKFATDLGSTDSFGLLKQELIKEYDLLYIINIKNILKILIMLK